MEDNSEPNIVQFLVKILNSIAFTLMWIIAGATAGIYYKLGYTNGKPLIYTILFYTGMLISLFFLIRYLNKIWKNG